MHFGFSIPENNLDEMVRQVVAAGGKTSKAAATCTGPVCLLRDPDGYVIELGNS